MRRQQTKRIADSRIHTIVVVVGAVGVAEALLARNTSVVESHTAAVVDAFAVVASVAVTGVARAFADTWYLRAVEL